jgi:hypothetical protein
VNQNLRNNEKDLIDSCLQKLRELNCCEVEFNEADDFQNYDGLLKLFRHSEQFEYIVEVNKSLSYSKADIVLHKIKSFESGNKKILLFTDYVNPNIAEKFRKNVVEFVDATGNLYINQQPLYIYITGQKGKIIKERPPRAFSPTGLKIIFLFLKKPEAVNWNYRDIGEATGAALGGVGWIMGDLRSSGFIRVKVSKNAQRQRELVNRQKLLDRWEVGYVEKLRPKLFRNRYRIAGQRTINDLLEIIKDINISNKILIGGELGAKLLGENIRPQRATLHLADNYKELINNMKLVPDNNGNIDILEAFGIFNNYKEIDTFDYDIADPLLIRAELISFGIDRLNEIADDILNNYISKRLELS